MTAGGLFTASFDLLGIVLTVFGVWDWIEVLAEDADEMNRQIALQRALQEYTRLLEQAEEEIHRRIARLP